VLLVCGLRSRSVRDALCLAEKDDGRSPPAGCCLCWRFSARRGGATESPPSDYSLEIRPRNGNTISRCSRPARSTLGERRKDLYTSAGISAGIDLALAWVEEDCGAGLAHQAARELVLFLRRPGGQPQLSVSLASQASEMMSIRELQIWIAEHLQTKLSVEDLADRMSMGVRNTGE
jgi:hypothetical protein